MRVLDGISSKLDSKEQYKRHLSSAASLLYVDKLNFSLVFSFFIILINENILFIQTK